MKHFYGICLDRNIDGNEKLFLLFKVCANYASTEQSLLPNFGTWSLVLFCNPSSDGVTKKKQPYGLDVYISQPCTPSFRIGLVKTESELLDQLRLT